MRNVPEVWAKAAELVTKAGIAKVAERDGPLRQ